MDKLFFSWLSHPADLDNMIYVPNYQLSDTVLHDCSQNYTAGNFNFYLKLCLFCDTMVQHFHSLQKGKAIIVPNA